MSFWIERESQTKTGRIEIITVPFVELFFPLIMLLGIVVASGMGGALLLMTAGFLLFLIAKLSLIARGVYVSWGSRRMSPAFRVCYRLGYALMVLAILVGLASLWLGLFPGAAPRAGA